MSPISAQETQTNNQDIVYTGMMMNTSAENKIELDYQQVDVADFPQVVSRISINDEDNMPVQGLNQNNFTIYEDSVIQSPVFVEEFMTSNEPLHVVLVMDRSGSMKDAIDNVKKAAATFITMMNGRDYAAIISFNENVTIDHTFSQDTSSLINAVDNLQARGSTAIYDAVISAANLLDNVTGRKAVILMTDGRDWASSATVDDAVKHFRNFPVFSIGLGTQVSETALQTMADSSGGQYYFSPESDDLVEIFSSISGLLRQHEYHITYTTHNRTTDGSLRHVRINTIFEDSTAVGNNTYQAPEHIPTVIAATQNSVSPLQEFRMRLDIPSTSPSMQNLYSLSCIVKYDHSWLQIKKPYADNIIPTSFWGKSSDFAFTFHNDSIKGEITLNFQRRTDLLPAEGYGAFAELCFTVDIDMQDNSSLDFEIVDLIARDETGWPVIVKTDTLHINSFGTIVWPGDTNHNGTVELSDVNVLGLFWGTTGTPRTTDDQMTWEPKLAGRYTKPTGAHVDADGSGIVDVRDLFPIGLNWRKNKLNYSDIVPKSTVRLQRMFNGKVWLKLEEGRQTGEYHLKVQLENTADIDLAGAAFCLNYPSDAVRIASVISGKVWGSSPLSVRNNNASAGKFAMSLVIPAGSPVKGSNNTLVNFILHADSPPNIDTFKLDDVAVLFPNGELLELTTISNVSVRDKVPKDFVLNRAYPNPFYHQTTSVTNIGTTLQLELPEMSQVNAVVFNTLGQRVRVITLATKEQGNHLIQWDGLNDEEQASKSGLYFIRIEAVGESGRLFHKTQKVSLIH